MKKMHVILKNLKNEIPLNKLSFIIGDSMVKNVDGYLLTGSLNCKFIVNSDIYILHVGKNNLILSDTTDQIAEHIFDIVSSLKTDSNTIIVFNTVPRGNKNKEKA